MFINEFHYDNVSTDTGEFIEVAGPANTDLTGWSIELYNGNGGASYGTIALSGAIDDEGNGGGALYFDDFSNVQSGAIQNGSPDGIALIDNLGNVVQFLSYEGAMTASGGPADGMTSTDIGVAETGSTPVGQSLQLTGTGSQDSDFTWAGPSTSSPGSLNAGQTYQGSAAAATVSIAAGDAVKPEGDSGTTSFTFTVSRSGDGTGAVSVDYSVVAGDTDTADFGGSLPTGTVNFADGDTAPKTITINVSGDTDTETNETFDVVLSNIAGATLGNATASGTIQDDDALLPSVFINEFHYDNVSTDTGEFVEVAGPAGTDLTGWSIELYNGNGGASYGTIALSGVIDDEGNGGGALAFDDFSNVQFGAIQNGSPDGIALIDNLGNVVQFLSYEGSMTAVGGPADGAASEDVGVEEASNTPVGESLQLIGMGSQYSDFTWTGPTTASPGSLNSGQTFQGSTGAATVNISVDDASKAEGNSGTTSFTFTVTRTGNAAGAVSVDFNVVAVDTDASDFGGALPSGTVNFSDGDTAPKIITINVSGDTDAETNEAFDVVLSNASGATIGNATASGTIQDDDTPLPNVVINEFVVNHVGTDVDEFIEIFGDANTDLSSLTLLVIEGDGSVAGTIDNVFPLASQSTDVNGYFTNFSNNIIENGSITLLLVSDFSGSAGTDLDTDNDGILDVTPWSNILDDVSVDDGGAGDLHYSTSVLSPGQDGNALSFGGASRIPNGTDTDSAADWRRNHFNGDGLPSIGETFQTPPGEAVNTPGAVNYYVNTSPTLIVQESDSSTEVSEAGQTDTFQVSLSGNPSSPVTVTITPSNSQLDLGNGPGAAVVLVLNDSLPQLITVAAVDDAAIEGLHTASIGISTSSSDSNYNGLSGSVSVSISDNDSTAPYTIINEFVANHSGVDTDAFVEVLSSSNADLSSLSIVEISGNSPYAGEIASVTQLSTSDANGYQVVLNDFFNNSMTLLLVENFSGQVGDDLDTDDDGILDFEAPGASTTAPWSAIRDSIAVHQGSEFVYTNVVLEAGFDGNSFLPGGASRIPNGTDTDTAADWVRNDFNGEGLASLPGAVAVPGDAINTPGAANAIKSGLNLVESNGNTAVVEAGASDTIDFSLGTIPSSVVTVTVTPDGQLDLGSGAGVPIQLLFQPDASSATPVTVTVNAFDDTIAEGSHTGLISISYSSSDAAYNGTAPDITVSIADDDAASPSVVISELMYNPNSSEAIPLAEWIEVVNVGPGSVDLSGWKFDDEDSTDWGAIPGGTILTEGQVAVFFDAAFTTAADFRSDWNVPASALVIGIDWGSLSNSPSDTNEILALLDGAMVQQDLVNYDDAGDWPSDPGGPSIYLTNLSSDNNVGTNWAQSVVGVDGAINPNGVTFDVTDVGSPGVVPTASVAPDVIVTESDDSTLVVEGGATDSIDLVLQGTPTDDVTITLTPSNNEIDLGLGAGVPVVVTFMPGTAATPQTVTITAVNDTAVEGLHSSEISFSVTSADGNYNGLAVSPVSVTIVDDDAPVSTNAVINEFVADHTGTDDYAFVEIFAPGVSVPTDLSGLTLLEIEGGASNRGTIDKIAAIGLTDANGYFVANLDAENDTVTYLLVSGFTGSVGDDLDTNDDGILDATPWTAIVDSVATIDNPLADFAYADAPALTPDLDGDSFQYGGASRIPNGTDTDTVNDWVRNNFSGAGFAAFPGATPNPGEALNTPGAANVVSASDTVAPTILAVKVAGSSWSSAFLTSVDAAESEGWLLEEANQLRNLSWTNVDTIYVQFSEDIGDFTAADFALVGVNVPDYAAASMIGSVSYDSGSFVATIHLSTPFAADKVLLQIEDGVTDLAGNQLDGEWTDSVSTESGNGTAGGDFNFRFNVLPGDVNGNGIVLGDDVLAVNGKTFTFPGFPSYDPFTDIDGSGSVLGDDVLAVNGRTFTFLPGGEPVAPAPLVASLATTTSDESDSWSEEAVDELFALIDSEL
ncbi:hypothetical protein C5Y97_07990 [Blastopirellula marina]|uniref:LTD domain-containing protein n=1 Tax=Blastopirellula marina TaxID=124 RepID=A0A2S8G0P6_9BACT|nr:hypothetical protein C5Y98_07990 [Blastopirellula marina]PTL44675.1 hypothetical protein C5Y97_07990 [Blastopirellula marina]